MIGRARLSRILIGFGINAAGPRAAADKLELEYPFDRGVLNQSY